MNEKSTSTDLFFELAVNGTRQFVKTIPQDITSRSKVKFCIRQWTTLSVFDIPCKVTAKIGTREKVLFTLELAPARNDSGKRILTASQDSGSAYAWSTLTKGYGQTTGLTAGIIFHPQTKKTESEPEQLPLWAGATA
jgi:hypothetical protein